ncbi:MAG: nucleotidyl transferase AbiEii/AbiGii toxin family protein, partial [Alcanivorax sp.]
PEERGVVAAVEDEFGFAQARIVAIEDLYAGKLCAALDRQHPRDWFDVMLLDENEGITTELRKAFLVYLISHPRPMEELLAPNWKQQESLFEGEFRGMAFREVTLEEMRLTMEKVLVQVVSTMTPEEKRFLCSLYEGDPQWRLLGLDGVMSLPAVKWKLQNIRKMDSAKRAASLERLRQILVLAE